MDANETLHVNAGGFVQIKTDSGKFILRIYKEDWDKDSETQDIDIRLTRDELQQLKKVFKKILKATDDSE